MEDGEEETPHDETGERWAHEKVGELEEEVANLRRAWKEKEDQRINDEETLQRIRSERGTAEQERDQKAKELRAETNEVREYKFTKSIKKRTSGNFKENGKADQQQQTAGKKS